MSTPTVIEFFVEGTPVGQPRVKHRIVHPKSGKAFAALYTPATADAWKSVVQIACYGKVRSPLLDPLHVHITAFFARPQRLLTKTSQAGPIAHTAKPDKDNVEKAILDAMKDAGLYRDDAQVCGGSTFKYYAAIGTKTGARIRVEIVRSGEEIPFGEAAAG